MLNLEDNELLARVGKATPMGAMLRRYWVPCLLSEEIPQPDSPPVRVRILGEDLIAFRDTSGRVGLLDRFCAHRGASLFFGRNEEEGLRCAYHGWKYNVTGHCVDMPSEPPESNFKDKIRMTAYPVRERGGVIWGYLGPKELEPDFPRIEWTLVPDDHRYVSKSVQDCNWLQALEGGLDSSHISFLHSTLESNQSILPGIGDSSLGAIAKADSSPRFFVQETRYGAMIAARRGAGADRYYWRITQWLLPFLHLIPAEPGAVVTGNAYVPMDDAQSMVYRISWNAERALKDEELRAFQSEGYFHTDRIPATYLPVQNRDNDYLIDREVQRTKTFTGIKGIQAQDQAMIENMRGGNIANRSQEHLGTSDTAIISTRRRLLRDVRALQDGSEPAAPAHPEAFAVRSAALLLPHDVPYSEGARDLLISRV